MLRRCLNCTVLGVVLLVGCSGSSPSAPSPASLTGSWSGSYAVTVGGSNTGPAVFQLTHSGATVTGTGTLDPGTPIASSGVVAGFVSGNGLIMEMVPSNPAICPIRFNGTWTRNRISGQWVAFNCAANFGGTLELRR